MTDSPVVWRQVRTSIMTLIVLGLLSGCAGRGAPPLEYFSLNTTEPVAEPLNMPVRVSRVRVPEYIDNDRIWVRENDQRMVSVPGVRWSEPIAPAITRELRIALGAVMTEDRSAPNLLVDIERLEARWMDDSQIVFLRARWQLDGNPGIGPQTWEAERTLNDREAESIALAKADLLTALRAEIRRQLSTTLSISGDH